MKRSKWHQTDTRTCSSSDCCDLFVLIDMSDRVTQLCVMTLNSIHTKHHDEDYDWCDDAIHCESIMQQA